MLGDNPSRGEVKKQLTDIVTEGQMSLAKWIITLSTGAIVFSVRLIKPGAAIGWKAELIFGLTTLIISVVLGVRYVRRSLDGLMAHLNILVNEDQYASLDKSDVEKTMNFNNKETKVKDVIKSILGIINKNKDRLKIIDIETRNCYLWQQRLFYLGISLIAAFGLFNI